MQESCGLEARAYPSPQARASPSPQARASPSPPLSLPPTPKPAMSHIHPSPPLSSPSLPPPPSHPLPFPPPPTSRLNLHALSTCQFLLLYRFSPFLFSFFLFSFNLPILTPLQLFPWSTRRSHLCDTLSPAILFFIFQPLLLLFSVFCSSTAFPLFFFLFFFFLSTSLATFLGLLLLCFDAQRGGGLIFSFSEEKEGISLFFFSFFQRKKKRSALLISPKREIPSVSPFSFFFFSFFFQPANSFSPSVSPFFGGGGRGSRVQDAKANLNPKPNLNPHHRGGQRK